MLADYLGEKKFRAGLRYYLKKHSYGNASTGQLWQAFQKVSGKPVGRLMRAWTSQAGHPMLTVSPGNKGKQGQLQLEQSRFFPVPSLNRKHQIKQYGPFR